MGAYVYKVLTTPIPAKSLKSDRTIYPSKYAYKPCIMGRDREKLNHKMAWSTGCIALEAAWRKRYEKGLVQGPVYSAPYVEVDGPIYLVGRWGTYSDDGAKVVGRIKVVDGQLTAVFFDNG